jgi:hypothetical protein
LRRQADVFTDLEELQSKLGRDPSERPAIRSVRSSPISKKLTGLAACRIHADKGYRGHNYPDRLKV